MRSRMARQWNAKPFLPKVLALIVFLCSYAHGTEDTTETLIHQSGYCSQYGYCAQNDNGKVPCADNRPAVRINDSLAEKIAEYCPYLWSEISTRRLSCCTEETVISIYEQMSQAYALLSSCPACWNNFANLWCTISCSPDQSLFADVAKTIVDQETNKTAVREVHFHFTEDFKETLYDSCKDVKYGVANLPVMMLFGGSESADDFLSFLGTPLEQEGQAPYSLKFPHEDQTPPGMEPHARELPDCGSPTFECSCADCSHASYCKTVLFKKDEDESSCKGALRCYEYAILVVGIVLLASVLCVIWIGPFEQSMQRITLLDDASDHSYEVLGDDDDEYHAVLLEGDTLHYPPIERWLRRQFHRLGIYIAEHPYFIIIISLSLIGLISLGNVFYQLETTPQGLWTPKDSRADKEQKKYESSFGPYYRVQNLIIRTKKSSSLDGSSTGDLPKIVSNRTMHLMFDIQDIVDSIEAHVEEDDHSTIVKLTDVCYKPLGVCVIESVLQYWQMNRTNWESLMTQGSGNADADEMASYYANDCFQHWTTKCHSNFQAPIDPKIVLGGYPLDDSFESYVKDTTAFVVTYLLNSDQRNEKAALAWEEAFIKVAKHNITDMVKEPGLDASFIAEPSTEAETEASPIATTLTEPEAEASLMAEPPTQDELESTVWAELFTEDELELNSKIEDSTGPELEVSFMAERSTEDELDRETYMDASTIVGSYLVMFAYIALSLTFLTKRHRMTSSNLSVQSHVMLALQGIGIVVLSVVGALGIISVFQIKVSLIVLEVIPFLVLAVGVDNMFILANELRSLDPVIPISIRLASALAQVGPSITCAALAETLAFALATIAPIPAVRNFSICASVAILLNFFLQCTLFTALLLLDTTRRESNRVDCCPWVQSGQGVNQEEPEYVVRDAGTPSQQSDVELPENYLQQGISKFYIPFLFGSTRRIVHSIILSITVIAFTASVVLIGRMERGLEEHVAFPKDSYLQDYFTEGLPLMRVGAPVMFVVNDLNVSDNSGAVNRVCGVAGCDHDSLVSQIDLAASIGAYHLASPTASWIDDFLMWLNTPNCCRTRGNSTELCPYDDEDPSCTPCSLFQYEEWNKYKQFLPGFMQIAPNEICPRGGKGAYEDYLEHERDNSSAVIGLDNQIVRASSFRTYYSPLVTQTDYIEAMSDTNKFADELSKDLDMDIYAYSLFHVFFQQYLHIVDVAILMIAVAVLAVFLVCWLLLSSLTVAILVILCVIMIVVDLVGASYLADVKLNGVSVVNMTMAVGIGVEFCVHLAHAFLVLPGSRLGRVSSALRGVGVSIISGIAITKFLGVIMLALAKTKLVEIYYFRMYMALVVLGAWHGLVVLPVLLALFGPMSPVTRIRSTPNDTITNAEKDSNPPSPLIPQSTQYDNTTNA